MNILIKDTQLFDMDSKNGYLEHQDIIISGNIIESIKPTGEEIPGYALIDGRDLFVTPGLINAHTHSTENLLRGSSEQTPLEIWLTGLIETPIPFTPDLIYLAALVGVVEMLRKGTTAVMDHLWVSPTITYESLDAVMKAYELSGFRASVAPMLEDQDLISDVIFSKNFDIQNFSKKQYPKNNLDETFYIVEKFISKWNGVHNDRLHCFLGPGGLQWCSGTLLDKSLELCGKYNTGLHLHLNETKIQADICKSVYGRSAISELKKRGVLSPSTSLAHAVWIDEFDIETIANSGSSVVHNPVSNLKLGSGIAPIPTMLEKKIHIALGADGAASNDNQDMFSVMKITGLIHTPVIHKSNFWISSKDILTMATIGGAKVLGYSNKLGAVREGYLADLVFFDRRYLQGHIFNDPTKYFVYSETGASIKHVMIDGAWVIKDGTIVNFDEEEIFQELFIKLNKLLSKYKPDSTRLFKYQNLWKTGINEYIKREKN
ncbi:MAG: amidohydrolase family protein [Anaerolineaceae bacterium]